MKTKTLLILNTLYQLFRLIATAGHRNCATLENGADSTTYLKFNSWEKIKVVYVFYHRDKNLKMEIKNAFPYSDVIDSNTGLSSSEAKNLVDEKRTMRGDKVVFIIDPLDTKNIIITEDIKDTRLKHAGPIDYFAKEFSQKRVRTFLAIFDQEEIKPFGNFYQILIEPHQIPYKLKSNAKKLIKFTRMR